MLRSLLMRFSFLFAVIPSLIASPTFAQEIHLKSSATSRTEATTGQSAVLASDLLRKENFNTFLQALDGGHLLSAVGDRTLVKLYAFPRLKGVENFLFVASDSAAEAERLFAALQSQLAKGPLPATPRAKVLHIAKKRAILFHVYAAHFDPALLSRFTVEAPKILNRHGLKSERIAATMFMGKNAKMAGSVFAHPGFAPMDDKFAGVLVFTRDSKQGRTQLGKMRGELEAITNTVRIPPPAAVTAPPIVKAGSLYVKFQLDWMNCSETTEDFLGNDHDEVYFHVLCKAPIGSGTDTAGNILFRFPSGDARYEFGERRKMPRWRDEDNHALPQPTFWVGELKNGETALITVCIQEDDDGTLQRIDRFVAKSAKSLGKAVGYVFGSPDAGAKVGEAIKDVTAVLTANADDHLATFAVGMRNHHGKLETIWYDIERVRSDRSKVKSGSDHAMYYETAGPDGNYQFQASVVPWR